MGCPVLFCEGQALCREAVPGRFFGGRKFLGRSGRANVPASFFAGADLDPHSGQTSEPLPYDPVRLFSIYSRLVLTNRKN